MPIGFIVGLPFGTFIKKPLGYVVLYSIASGVIFIAMVYVFFVVKDSRKEKKQKDKEPKSEIALGCNKGK